MPLEQAYCQARQAPIKVTDLVLHASAQEEALVDVQMKMLVLIVHPLGKIKRVDLLNLKMIPEKVQAQLAVEWPCLLSHLLNKLL